MPQRGDRRRVAAGGTSASDLTTSRASPPAAGSPSSRDRADAMADAERSAPVVADGPVRDLAVAAPSKRPRSWSAAGPLVFSPPVVDGRGLLHVHDPDVRLVVAQHCANEVHPVHHGDALVPPAVP